MDFIYSLGEVIMAPLKICILGNTSKHDFTENVFLVYTVSGNI